MHNNRNRSEARYSYQLFTSVLVWPLEVYEKSFIYFSICHQRILTLANGISVNLSVYGVVMVADRER